MPDIKSFQKQWPEVRPAGAQGVPMGKPERPPEPRGDAVAVSRRTGRTRLLSGKPLLLQAHGLRGGICPRAVRQPVLASASARPTPPRARPGYRPTP